MAKPQRVSREDRFPISAAALWALVGNTDQVNRLIGLPKVDFGAAEESPEGLFRPAVARQMGLTLAWREYAFDFVRERSHAVTRVYSRGPLERMWMGLELTDEVDGCRMRQFAEVTVRRSFPLASLLVPFIVRKSMRDLVHYCREQAALQAQPQPLQPFPRQAPQGVQRGTLRDRLERLRTAEGSVPAVVDALGTLLAEGTDPEVLRMRPFALARQWGLGREDVLETFLRATVLGLLELDWELMCPNCRVPKSGFHTFGGVTEDFHCDLCGTEYRAELDRTTELRFSVHPAVRKAEDVIYCIGGPHNARHVLAQVGLNPGEAKAQQAELADEPLRVRVLRLNRTLELQPHPDGAQELALTFDGERWQGEGLRFRPGPARLAWNNASLAHRMVVLERVDWDPDACTAARVMALPEFRTMFSTEVLQSGRQIGVRNLCVLFTDLKGSTALYEQVGDAPAYGRVHRHFDFLIDCFKRHEGGIVKTIGDAVMASFPTALAALRAAVAVQQRVAAFNARLALPEPLVIKIGLHHGPAIAVNANGQMDYFGRTVNIAARIQGLSAGDDIVLSEALWAEPELQALLRETACQTEHFSTPLKGIAGETALCRLSGFQPAAVEAGMPATQAPGATPSGGDAPPDGGRGGPRLFHA